MDENSQFQDDPSILDEDLLLRRIPVMPNMFLPDGDTGILRPTSVCFRDRETNGKELSMTIEKDMLASGLTHEKYLAAQGTSNAGLASIEAGFVRKKLSAPQVVVRDRTELDEFHCLVVGEKTKADERKLARGCLVVIPPASL